MRVTVDFFKYYPNGCEDDDSLRMEARVRLTPSRLKRLFGSEERIAQVIERSGDAAYRYFPSNRRLVRHGYQNGGLETGSRIDSLVIDALDDLMQEARQGVNPLAEDWIAA